MQTCLESLNTPVAVILYPRSTEEIFIAVPMEAALSSCSVESIPNTLLIASGIGKMPATTPAVPAPNNNTVHKHAAMTDLLHFNLFLFMVLISFEICFLSAWIS